MNKENRDGDIRIDSPSASRWENFWYYNKWKIIVGIFVIFVLIVCIKSCAKEKFDIVVTYCGPYKYSANEEVKVKEELSSILPKDYNGDGKKSVSFLPYHVMTETQIKEYKAQIGNENAPVADSSYFSTQSQMYSNYIMTGECAILLLDPDQYRKLVSLEGRLRKLSDVFVSIPAGAIDDYGVVLCSTELYRESTYLQCLPDDTVLCLLNPYVIGNTKKPELYAQMVETFVAMAKAAEDTNDAP